MPNNRVIKCPACGSDMLPAKRVVPVTDKLENFFECTNCPESFTVKEREDEKSKIRPTLFGEIKCDECERNCEFTCLSNRTDLSIEVKNQLVEDIKPEGSKIDLKAFSLNGCELVDHQEFVIVNDLDMGFQKRIFNLQVGEAVLYNKREVLRRIR